jgi:Transposase
MDYFAGLDISMDETHVCVLDREGAVVRESKTASTADTIAGELAKAPSCRRIVFETGRMAPILFHGLNQLGLPVVCVESRQAYQALKSLATHKTDRNDARGLAHLARTGFFKPVHVKSLSAHAPFAHHRAQEAGGPARDLGKSDPRFGSRVRDPAASRADRRLHRSGSQGKRGGCWSLRRHTGLPWRVGSSAVQVPVALRVRPH